MTGLARTVLGDVDPSGWGVTLVHEHLIVDWGELQGKPKLRFEYDEGVAAIVEILAYYVPGLDNLLDTLATPAAFVAGTVVSAAVITELPPLVKWAAAIIAGGGIAGLTQSLTTVVRAKSTMMTGTASAL